MERKALNPDQAIRFGIYDEFDETYFGEPVASHHFRGAHGNDWDKSYITEKRLVARREIKRRRARKSKYLVKTPNG